MDHEDENNVEPHAVDVSCEEVTITDVDPSAPLNEVITSMTLSNKETGKVKTLNNFIKLALRITLRETGRLWTLRRGSPHKTSA